MPADLWVLSDPRPARGLPDATEGVHFPARRLPHPRGSLPVRHPPAHPAAERSHPVHPDDEILSKPPRVVFGHIGTAPDRRNAIYGRLFHRDHQHPGDMQPPNDHGNYYELYSAWCDL